VHSGPRNGLVRTQPEPKHSLGRPARLRCQQQYLSLCEHACLQPSSWRNVSRAMTHSEATGYDSSSTARGARHSLRGFRAQTSIFSRVRTQSSENAIAREEETTRSRSKLCKRSIPSDRQPPKAALYHDTSLSTSQLQQSRSSPSMRLDELPWSLTNRQRKQMAPFKHHSHP
jgi:hypothetical protein